MCFWLFFFQHQVIKLAKTKTNPFSHLTLLVSPGNPGASNEDFRRACVEAQLGFVDALPEKYHTFVGPKFVATVGTHSVLK